MCYMRWGDRITIGSSRLLTNLGKPSDMAEVQKLKPPDVVITDSPSEFISYASVSGVAVSADDVMIHFGLRRTDKANEADGVAKVFISLPHAKRLMLVFIELLKEYEIIFGEIQTEAEKRLTEEGLKRFQVGQEEQKNVAETK